MSYSKVTPGYIEQVFDDEGKFLHQTFVASDEDAPVVYDEDGNNDDSEFAAQLYHMFEI